MTEREYVTQMLAGYREHVPAANRAELAAYLADFLGRAGAGGSGWLPHVRSDESFRGVDGRVRAEWRQPQHMYRYSCRRRGVYLGEMCHMRQGKPDITWDEIADYALGGERPVQLDLFATGNAA